MTFMSKYVQLTPSSLLHESILACSILYWFWEFRAHHSLDKYLKTKVNNFQSEQNFEGFERVHTNILKVNNFQCYQTMELKGFQLKEGQKWKKWALRLSTE